MTQQHPGRFRRVLFIAGTAGALTLGLAGSALAGSAPTPTPSPSGAPAPLGYSLPGQGHHDSKMRPEAGDLLIASVPAPGTNNVDAYGPVHGIGGTDTQFAPTLDRFNFANGDSVNVLHQASGPVVLDVKTCTATSVLHDGWYKFLGGTGDDQGARGSGLFTEVDLFSFAIDSHGKCVFDQHGKMHSDGPSAGYGDQPYMRDHDRNLRPVFFSTEVQFKGTASVRHHEECPPVYHAPDNSATYGQDHGNGQENCQAPNAAPTGQPTGSPAGKP